MEPAAPTPTEPSASRLELARAWLPRAVAAAAFVMFALAAPPGPYWLDSSELGAAGAGLGSAHPTGFPLLCALARLATLVPIGELAFRIHLLSAACGALAVLWTCRLVVEACQGDAAGLAGGAGAGGLLALAFTFFRQATVTEVYAPTAAVIAASLLLYARVGRGAGGRTGLSLALVAGLGAGLHASYRLLLAAPLALLLLVRLRFGARWPLAAPLLAVLGAAGLYAYLPVRAAGGHAARIDWGHPRTLAALADHVSAARIRRAYAGQMMDERPTVVAQEARRFADRVVDDLGPIGLCAAAAGLAWLLGRRRDRWLGGALAVVAVGDALYSVWLNPMGQRDLQNGVPLELALAAAAGAGIAWLARTLGRAAPFAGGAAVVIVAVPVALAGGDRWAAARGDAPRAWVEAALAELPPRGIALVQGDSTAAGLLWATTAEAARPDAAVVVRQHLWDVERTRAVLAAAGAQVPPGLRVDSVAALATLGRPLWWEPGLDAPPAPWRAAAGTPLAALSNGPPVEAADPAAADVVVTRVFAGADAADPAARHVAADAWSDLGRAAYRARDLDRAETCFHRALAADPGGPTALVNLGTVAAARGRLDEAAALTERALALDPVEPVALVNAARYRLRLGDDARARRLVDRALVVAPERADAWTLAGILAARAGDVDGARARLERALALDPHEAEARATLGKLAGDAARGAPR